MGAGLHDMPTLILEIQPSKVIALSRISARALAQG